MLILAIVAGLEGVAPDGRSAGAQLAGPSRGVSALPLTQTELVVVGGIALVLVLVHVALLRGTEPDDARRP